jgi:ionotropic kainate glutamate receptor 2
VLKELLYDEFKQKCYFFCLTQDIETFDLEDFKYNFVNMTAFRMVDAEDVGVREILRDMERFQPLGHSILNKSRIIQVKYCIATLRPH